MQNNNPNDHTHSSSYSSYIIIWIALLALTSITVTVAGINLGNYTLMVALFIAAVKSSLVINIFMHIKFDEPIFRVFLLISAFTLLVIFALTFFDYTFR